MKVSFPFMGTSHIGFKHLIQNLGHEVLMPPNPTKRTLTYGARYSPEFACIPFKMLLGTYIEVLEMGADLLISSGGIGPCRAGLYGLLHEKILQDLRYDFTLIILDPPLADVKVFLNNIKTIKPRKMRWTEFGVHVKTAWKKLRILDKLEMLASEIRPYEITRGDTSNAFRKAIHVVDSAETGEEVVRSEGEGEEILRSVPTDAERIPLKVGIVGEIYVVIEPFMNMDIERRLGEMGVAVHRSTYITTYTQYTIWDRKGEDHIKKAAEPYLRQLVGGHGIHSVGETVLYAQQGFDGVIQIAPFTCIPEIVARSIIPKITEDWEIPVLTINIDEQTGESGIQTRLEAFIDLLKEKRKLMGEEKTNALLSGC